MLIVTLIWTSAAASVDDSVARVRLGLHSGAGIGFYRDEGVSPLMYRGFEIPVIGLNGNNFLDIGTEPRGDFLGHGLGVGRLGVIEDKHLGRLFLRGARYGNHHSESKSQH